MVPVITRMDFGEVVRGVLPFYIPLFVALGVVTLFPGISTWLPELVMQ